MQSSERGENYQWLWQQINLTWHEPLPQFTMVLTMSSNGEEGQGREAFALPEY